MSGDEHEPLASYVAPLWSARKTMGELGVDAEVLDRLREDGDVLGVRATDGDRLYPLAQFERTSVGTVRVKPDLLAFFRELRGHEAWTIAILLNTPAPELEGLCPLDWVKQRRPKGPLIDYGQLVHLELSRR